LVKYQVFARVILGKNRKKAIRMVIQYFFILDKVESLFVVYFNNNEFSNLCEWHKKGILLGIPFYLIRKIR